MKLVLELLSLMSINLTKETNAREQCHTKKHSYTNNLLPQKKYINLHVMKEPLATCPGCTPPSHYAEYGQK